MAETNIPAPGAPQAPAAGQIPTSVEGQAPAPQAETNDLSTKFAHLARKTKAFREEQRKFQTERESWKSQEAKYQAAMGLEQRLNQDPLSVLAERGITQDQLTALLVNQQNPQEANMVFQLQQQNKELMDKIDKINKRFEDNESSSYQQALNQIKNDTKILVASDASNYEMISKAGDDGIESVAALIKVMWEEDQVLMSVQDAAEQVEQELLERSITLASANKVKAKLSPPPPVADPKLQPIPGKSQPTRTLNSQAAQSTSRPLSRKERAILAFKGQL